MSVLADLTVAVRAAFAARFAGEANVGVEPLLNWGGFVNRSFRVDTPSGRYHLKLANEAKCKADLRKWWSVHERLEERYHAPRALDGIDIAEAGYSGILFEWISGATPEAWSEGMVSTMSELLHRLHNDGALAAELEDADSAQRTCVDVYRATFHRRFVEDLRGIAGACPPFVSEDRLRWMHEQVAKLEEQARKITAFAEPARFPTHGDVWLNNVLISEDGRLYLLDWDGLELGDPAMDWAMLYGPSRVDPRPVAVRQPALSGYLSPAALERLQIWGQATLLDWIIDPLADWVEAAAEPEHGTAIRTSAEAVHRRALTQYLALWG